MAGVYSDRRAARSRSRVLPPSREENVRLLVGSPYLAIHLLEERVALLVALLVIANLLQLLHGKVVQASRDLLHVHLVVAGYREGGRLRRPLGSLGRSVQGATRGVGHGAGRRSQQAGRAPSTRHRPLLDAPHDLLGTRPVAGEGVVEEFRVGPDRLPRELLSGTRLAVPAGCDDLPGHLRGTLRLRLKVFPGRMSNLAPPREGFRDHLRRSPSLVSIRYPSMRRTRVGKGKGVVRVPEDYRLTAYSLRSNPTEALKDENGPKCVELLHTKGTT